MIRAIKDPGLLSPYFFPHKKKKGEEDLPGGVQVREEEAELSALESGIE